MTNHRRYDSFGRLLSETNPSLDFAYGFTGREFDEATGLQYNRNRWYDPNVGRWISQDPIGFEGGDQNLYGYVGNAPIFMVDPMGLEEWAIISYPVAFVTGVGQGGLNILNGAQDVMIGTANIAPGAWNYTGGWISGAQCPYVSSPDWSKDVLVRDDPTHRWSKGIGGQALFTLATLGASQLSNVAELRHLTSTANAVSISQSGIILGRGSIFATSLQPSWRATVFTFGTSSTRSVAIPISSNARRWFRPEPIIGPISALNRCLGGAYRANRQSISLISGEASGLSGFPSGQLIDAAMGQAILWTIQFKQREINDVLP